MDLAAVDLNLLVALEALIEESNVTRAATKVGLSQPAMSRALRRLRDLLSDPILVRGPRGMAPTARARSLAMPLRQLLDQIRDTLEPRKPFDPTGVTDTFTFSFPDAGQILLIPTLLQRLKQAAPNVNLNVIYQDLGGAQYGALESGEIDLGLDSTRKVPAGFRAEHLFDADYACIARKHHPLIGRRLTLRQFLTLGHIALRVESVSAEPDIDEILAKQPAKRSVVLSVPSYLSIPWLVADSDYIATVPRLLVRTFAEHFPIAWYDPPIPVRPLPVALIWHERTQHDRKYEWLRHAVATLFREVADAARPRKSTAGSGSNHTPSAERSDSHRPS